LWIFFRLMTANCPSRGEYLSVRINPLLKDKLTLSDKIPTHNGTTVVDFGTRNENPSYVLTELRDNIRRKIARYTAEQYREWLIRHPDEAENLNEQ
jgi:hypothetical protein